MHSLSPRVVTDENNLKRRLLLAVETPFLYVMKLNRSAVSDSIGLAG